MNIVGITNGPIYETLMLASKLSHLWFTSAFFSEYTRRLCRAIIDGRLTDQILTPYYDRDHDRHPEDGVGKYYDRIVFCSEIEQQELASRLQEIIRDTKDGMAELFLDPVYGAGNGKWRNTNNGFTVDDYERGREYLQRYLYSQFVITDRDLTGAHGEITLSEALSAAEMMRVYPWDNRYNPFIRLFAGDPFTKEMNLYVKKCALSRDIYRWSNPIMNDSGRVVSVSDIAMGVENQQNYRARNDEGYFAIVSADGDAVGKYTDQMTDEQIHAFSRCCMNYVSAAAAMIREYGGITIYAGGDDLLFLAPVMGRTGNMLYRLCKEINTEFRNRLRQEELLQGIQHLPTISFGISIQHSTYPLHEGMSESRHLLNDIVKGSQRTRNSMAIHWHPMLRNEKDVCLRVSNDAIDQLEQFLLMQYPGDHAYRLTLRLNSRTRNLITRFYGLLDSLTRQAMSPDHRMTENDYQERWVSLANDEDAFIRPEYLENLCRIYYRGFIANNGCDIEVPREYRPYDQRIGDEILVLISMLRLQSYHIIR